MNRRQFVQASLIAGAASLLRACGVRIQPTAAPTPTAPAPPVASSVPKVLRNENREGFYIRYIHEFIALDRSLWRLRVEGLVENPMAFDYDTLLSWPSVALSMRMKCVDCWSARAKWEGFTYDTLAAIVKPLPQASHIWFECADGYYEVLSIEELRNPRVLFVLKMNDALLPDEYGAPLRMMVPWKYGYKSAKAITALRFDDEGGAGYWSSVGPYTIDGNILAGVDHPLDTADTGRMISGGEITDY